jgi:hypothetical protein
MCAGHGIHVYLAKIVIHHVDKVVNNLDVLEPATLWRKSSGVCRPWHIGRPFCLFRLRQRYFARLHLRTMNSQLQWIVKPTVSEPTCIPPCEIHILQIMPADSGKNHIGYGVSGVRKSVRISVFLNSLGDDRRSFLPEMLIVDQVRLHAARSTQYEN